MAGQYTKLPGVTLTPSGTQDVNLTKVGGAAISEGQKAMAASLPVAIASDQSTLPVSVSSVPANQSVNINQVGGSSITEGQKAMAASLPVVIASDQSTLAVSAASLPLPSNAATSALQTTGNTSLASIDTKVPALGQALAASSVPVVLTAAQLTTLTPLTSVAVTQATASSLNATVVNAAGSAIMGKVGIDQTTPGTTNAVAVAQVGSTTVATGNGVVGTGVQRVAIASDNTAFSVNANNVNSSTSTLSNVASSASSVSILASNANAKGRFIFNESTATLYLKFGTTASTSSYTVQIAPNGYYEFPANPSLYTGACDGIWSAANGNARITELS